MADNVQVTVLREHLKDDMTLAYEGDTYTLDAATAREMPTLVKIKAEPAPLNKAEPAPANKADKPAAKKATR